MSERGVQLLDTADRQISELIDLLAAGGAAALSRTCPGREKMGDGTVAACALHTADRYQRIAEFAQAPGRHAEGDHDHRTHGGGDYTAENVALSSRLCVRRRRSLPPDGPALAMVVMLDNPGERRVAGGVVLGVLLVAVVSFQSWFSLQLLSQNGRALVRLEALEATVAAIGALRVST